jgi:hypothetical protein
MSSQSQISMPLKFSTSTAAKYAREIFDDAKNYIDMKRLRTHHGNTTRGKLFCSFISLIVISEIGNKLNVLMKKRG